MDFSRGDGEIMNGVGGERRRVCRRLNWSVQSTFIPTSRSILSFFLMIFIIIHRFHWGEGIISYHLVRCLVWKVTYVLCVIT